MNTKATPYIKENTTDREIVLARELDALRELVFDAWTSPENELFAMIGLPMQTYIALFRGINVGGRNTIKMADLRALLESLGLKDVDSYIQSGNVVFRSDTVDPSELAEQITTKIAENYDFEPRVLILTKEDFVQAMEANPFPEAESDDRRLHVNFLASVPDNPDMGALESVKKESEQFELKGTAFYLYAPDGIGRSKLAASAEKLLGVPMTGRNWRTVRKIMAMAEDIE